MEIDETTLRTIARANARAGGCTCEEPPVEITSESCENGHGPDCPGARTVRVLHRQFCRLRLARAASTN